MLRALLIVLAFFAAGAAPARALPMVEVPAAPRADAPDFFVIWLTGDGGWGKMEREISRRLAEHGVPTLGISSLRYYAVPRRPRDTAAEIAAIVPAYALRWGKTRFVLAGFSFGAASGPFVVQALPPAARDKLALAAFLSPGARANFWAGPWSWLGMGLGPKVWPVLSHLQPTPVLCIGGAGVFDDVCPDTPPPGMASVHLPGGHVLSGQYDEIARLIIAQAGLAPNPPSP